MLLALLAGSCSSGAPESGPDVPVYSLPFVDTTTADGARFGGIAQLGMQRLGELDPVSADLASDEVRILVDLLFDGLTAIDADTLEPVPAVASSWSVDEDLVTWRFQLATTQFANGREIEAADVKWSLERLVELRPDSRAAQNLSIIDGYDAFAAGDSDDIAGIVAEGSTEVTIVLSKPFAAFAHLLGAPVYGIVPAEVVTAGSSVFADQPAASGPFRVTERDESSLTLERTSRFSGSLHGIEVVFYEDPAAAYAAFLGGAIDWAAVPAESSGSVDRTVGRELFSPADATVYFGMNASHENLSDVNLRRAVLRAIDVDAVVADVLPAAGVASRGILPVGTAGARDDACGELCDLDASRAEATIGFLSSDGARPSVAIDYLAEDDTEQSLAEALADQLEAVGLDVELRPGSLTELSDRIVAGEHQIFRYGWSGSFLSPDAWLADSYSAASVENVSGLVDPAIDAFIRDARRATSAQDALAAYQAAEDLVLGHALLLPLVSLHHRSAVSARFHDVGQRPDATLDLDDAWLE